MNLGLFVFLVRLLDVSSRDESRETVTQERGAFPGWQDSMEFLLGLAFLFFFPRLDVTIFYSSHSFLTLFTHFLFGLMVFIFMLI